MRIYTFSELKESKLIFDKKAPPFGVIITLITLIFVTAIIIIAAFSVKTYVVKASSVVTSENKSYIMNGVSGSVKEIYVEEGDQVAEAAPLFSLDTTAVDLQIKQLQGTVDYLQQTIDNYYTLISFIDGYNLSDEESMKLKFDNTIASEKSFYFYSQQFIQYIESKTQDEIDELKSSFTSSYYSSIEEYSYQLISYKTQKEAYEESLDNYIITASSNGFVHFSSAITVGTVLQAGTLIGSISTNTDEDLYFETVISASERSKININDEVEIALTGVLQSEYGTLKGIITEIGSDSIQTDDGDVYYKIKIKTEATELSDKKGNVVKVTNGMLAESRIKYDETTWLKWVIEQIGVKLR